MLVRILSMQGVADDCKAVLAGMSEDVYDLRVDVALTDELEHARARYGPGTISLVPLRSADSVTLSKLFLEACKGWRTFLLVKGTPMLVQHPAGLITRLDGVPDHMSVVAEVQRVERNVAHLPSEDMDRQLSDLDTTCLGRAR